MTTIVFVLIVEEKGLMSDVTARTMMATRKETMLILNYSFGCWSLSKQHSFCLAPEKVWRQEVEKQLTWKRKPFSTKRTFQEVVSNENRSSSQ
jgi:hypothetical protein